MTRILALLLLAVLLVLAARQLIGRARRSPLIQLVEAIWRAGAAPGNVARRASEPDPEPVTRLAVCARCGVHVPVERLAPVAGESVCDRCRSSSARAE